MKNKRYKYLGTLALVITFCLLCSACNAIESVSSKNTIQPSVKVTGNHNWKRIDTEYCRLYYYDQESYVRDCSVLINDLYKEVFKKFQHKTKLNVEEDGLVTFLFMSGDTFKNFTQNSSSRAGWTGTTGYVNLDRKSEGNLEYTLRHELIHAVTCWSNDTSATDIAGWLAEGVAMYFQFNINSGKVIDEYLIKNALDKNELVPLSEISDLSSSNWGNKNIALKYTQSSSMYKFLIKKYGGNEINNIFYTSGDFYDNLKHITKKSINEIENDWIEYIKQNYK